MLTRCPDLNETFPFMLLGWKAEKVGGGYAMISPMWQQNVAGREATTDPGRDPHMVQDGQNPISPPQGRID